ncbi:MAG TPA: hypothetical protein VIE37_20260 [Methylomirabilota bacterium]|jgi:hypothetical protein
MLRSTGLLIAALPLLLGVSAMLPTPGITSRSDPDGPLHMGSSVFFESHDCSGPPFLERGEELPESLLPAVAILGPTRRVFIQVPGAEILPVAPGSVLVDAATCWSLGQPSFGPVLAVQGFHAVELAPLLAPRSRRAQGIPL